MDYDWTAIDTSGRRASGHGFQTLVGDYARFASRLRTSRLATEPPLSDQGFSEGYRELIGNLLDRCDLLTERLSHAGDGQVAMADNNDACEQVILGHINHTGLQA